MSPTQFNPSLLPSTLSSMDQEPSSKHRVVVLGLGMVGLKFLENMIEYDTVQQYSLSVFCEEPHLAYNRVGLTQYFSHRDLTQQLMQPLSWYQDNNIQLFMNQRAIKIHPESKQIESIPTIAPLSYDNNFNNTTTTVPIPTSTFTPYDTCIIATGSSALLPPRDSTPGLNLDGVIVYRTIADLEEIILKAPNTRSAAVIGGGLLGLEAAKACLDLKIPETIVYERNPQLLGRQLDTEGAQLVLEEIVKLGIGHSLGNAPTGFFPAEEQDDAGDAGDNGIESRSVQRCKLQDGTYRSHDLVIFAIGIQPRDEIAIASGINVAKARFGNGTNGILVNDLLMTSMPDVYAIGEVAHHDGMIYGLVAPGYNMAEVVARNLTRNKESKAMGPEHKERTFKGADMSTKLKLLGVHVASFGDYFADSKPGTTALVYRDPFDVVYKKYVFTKDGKHLLGGMMVGDTTDYVKLLGLSKSKRSLAMPPSELILGVKGAAGGSGGTDSLPDDAQICSCNNVTKGNIKSAIRTKGCTSLGQVKVCAKAGTGCGGCLPQVSEILESELKAMGVVVKQSLCPHFDYSRVELYQIIQVKKLDTFQKVMDHAGLRPGALGCEVCKPAVGSILASLYNAHVLDHTQVQDTNDRFLANIQRGGTYSVVPRVPAGEITPEKLVVIGQVAADFGLYSKITGGQRIDLFGAQRQDLPEIWERLINAGFESGHAYGKALRTVKSCVGSNWCRYGLRDSVGFATLIENRYKGIRAPHKLKGGVSGCVRECAEARGKDFGLIATEKGYNLYICGNGGATPKHAVLLVSDANEEQCVQYLDRFLMYYIITADRLTRTAHWLGKLEGGIEFLKKVILHDYLGINAELETQMAYLIATYQCEWRTVVEDPVRRAQFKQFVNSDETQSGIEYIEERGQRRPADWPKAVVTEEQNDAVAATAFPSPPDSPTIKAKKGKSNTVPSTAKVTRKLTTKEQALAEANSSETMIVIAESAITPETSLPSSPLRDEFDTELSSTSETRSWVRVGKTSDFIREGGQTIKYGKVQIAVFALGNGQWYATQNMCPHKRALVLATGLVGDTEIKDEATGESTTTPYVSCPMHKKNFALDTGKCLVSGEEEKYRLQTFEVKVDSEAEGSWVWLMLPTQAKLDQLLATDKVMIHAKETGRVAVGVTMNDRGFLPAAEGEQYEGERDEDVEIVSSSSSSCGGPSPCGDSTLDW